MKEIENNTVSVEEFIEVCLRVGYEYKDIMYYMDTIHKG